MGKTLNEIREYYGLEKVIGGDKIKIDRIRLCNDRCENYMIIQYEKLTTNNICSGCISKDTDRVKELLRMNKEMEEYSEEVEEVLNEML